MTILEQWPAWKAALPQETLLIVRLGDFYELFGRDAEIAARCLNIALTKRNGTPMCGFPYHAADRYIEALRQAGHTLACRFFIIKIDNAYYTGDNGRAYTPSLAFRFDNEKAAASEARKLNGTVEEYIGAL